MLETECSLFFPINKHLILANIPYKVIFLAQKHSVASKSVLAMSTLCKCLSLVLAMSTSSMVIERSLDNAEDGFMRAATIELRPLKLADSLRKEKMEIAITSVDDDNQ